MVSKRILTRCFLQTNRKSTCSLALHISYSYARHLFLAYHDSIRVYACSTSLLIRKLRFKRDSKLASFHLSPTDTDSLYACFEDGHIQLWNWSDGSCSYTWDTESSITASACAKISLSSAGSVDRLVTIDGDENDCGISVHQLKGMPGVEQGFQKTIYRTKSKLFVLRVSQDGAHTVAGARDRITIGIKIADKNSKSQEGLNYKWWEFDTPGGLLSLDCRVWERFESASEQTYPTIDVATGCQNGTIHRYPNIANTLSQLTRSKHHAEPTNKMLHWHRGPVSTVKWSRDGNYLISGGKETVLVLWQLDTGGHTHLPHLSSPICNVVVSPGGTSYAIHLADNSTMIISTQELQPTFNVPSVLLPSSVHVSNLRKDKSASNYVARRPNRRPAVTISRQTPTQIAIAVPTVASFHTSPLPSQGSSYLQTIDAKSGVQLLRQALTRTNVTDLNMGPDGFILDEPDTVLLQSSYDGKWLATVEEWSPPGRDLETLETSAEEISRARTDRLETCLKFWAWSEEASSWELVTKVEKPHSGSDIPQMASGIILDLVTDPSSTGFVTLGEDSSIKVWRAKTRFRHAVPVKDKHGRALMRWSSQQIIRLPPTFFTLPEHPSQCRSRIAVSNDGSTLVVGQSFQLSSVIFVIDLKASQLLAIRPDIFSGALRDVGFLNQHLIVVADQLISWDMVNDELAWAIDLRKQFTTESNRGTSQLAINALKGTFAVSFANYAKKGTRTWVAIFEATHSKPLLVHMIRQEVVALIADASRSFFGIDDKSQIHQIVPSAEKPSSEHDFGEEVIEDDVVEDDAQEVASSHNLDSIFGKQLLGAPPNDGKTDRLQPQPEPANDERNFIRQHQLTELFKYTQPFALPPITSMFEQVARLIAGVKSK